MFRFVFSEGSSWQHQSGKLQNAFNFTAYENRIIGYGISLSLILLIYCQNPTFSLPSLHYISCYCCPADLIRDTKKIKQPLICLPGESLRNRCLQVYIRSLKNLFHRHAWVFHPLLPRSQFLTEHTSSHTAVLRSTLTRAEKEPLEKYRKN